MVVVVVALFHDPCGDMTTPTSEDSQPQSNPPSRNSSFPNIGYFSSPFERWKDEQMDWASAFTLLGAERHAFFR